MCAPAPDHPVGGPSVVRCSSLLCQRGGDSVFGGAGDDLLLDDAGPDFLSGGPGDDAISVPGYGPGRPGLHEESDVISCVPGPDRVEAHPPDLVAADCEAVRRVPSPF